MRKRVLLISVPFMAIYHDILVELKNQGYEVTYMEDVHFHRNYFDIHDMKPNKFGQFIQGKIHKRYWLNTIKKKDDLYFDMLIVIDGFSLVNSGFIKILERYNPAIKKILYLFDKTYNNYCFDKLFGLFDKIYTFDIQDSKYYGISLLPIYWIPTSDEKKIFDIFGFGTYMPNRYLMYDYVDKLTKHTSLNTYIKLYLKDDLNSMRYVIGKYLNRNRLAPEIYESSLIVNETIPPSEYRRLLSSSKTILDTHDIVQDGLTARFMWALGTGAKIVTTNEAVKQYPFYDEEQIYVFDIEKPFVPIDFFMSELVTIAEKKKLINIYRIDNWIKELLS